ncbi:MAG: hypothetical protein WB420_14475, partial [Bradyrhizobium sp.]
MPAIAERLPVRAIRAPPGFGSPQIKLDAKQVGPCVRVSLSQRAASGTSLDRIGHPGSLLALCGRLPNRGIGRRLVFEFHVDLGA